MDHFKSVQKRRSTLGLCLSISWVIAFFMLFWLAFRTGEPTTGEHLDSVDWLPPSATDISFYKRDGFGWIKNYECSIPEDDFLRLAEKEGWGLQGEGNVLSYEKRYPNHGGVTVYYNRDTQRLFVHSAHR